MIREILEEKEPIAYRCLYNALHERRVAHSYLFSGEYHPLKKDAAILFAQSIIEGRDDFACEECATCQRIRNGSYLDFIYIDGYAGTIKREFIEDLMEEFSKTAVEESGKKVYVIANVNNASPKSLNMILKFMEEPGSENIYGIFLTDKKEDLLPTIVSRCEEIPFLQRDYSHLISDYEERGFDSTDAYLLSHILHFVDEGMDLNDPHYLTAKEYVYKTIETLDDRKRIPVLFSQEFYPSFRGDDLKKCTDWYLSIMVKMLEDAVTKEGPEDSEYQALCEKLRNADAVKLLSVFEDAKDKCLVGPDRRLLFDGIAYSILS